MANCFLKKMANCKYYWPSMLSNYVNERLHSLGSGGGNFIMSIMNWKRQETYNTTKYNTCGISKVHRLDNFLMGINFFSFKKICKAYLHDINFQSKNEFSRSYYVIKFRENYIKVNF